jgi:predicted AlkP superfamily phosphohydrolase/phosphomutase
MRMLIFGIDGGDMEILKNFNMPFLEQFIKNNNSILLKEDLFSRGWAEILTGQHGSNTRAFYMSPLLDGSHRFATKFSMSELFHDNSIVPMWELAEKTGHKYLIMNVPTTTPVPRTKIGIIVGSGGGGLNKIEGIPDELVSDEKTKEFLLSNNYIPDIRTPNRDFSTLEELVENLNKMETIRTNCFIDLCRKNNVQFGFLVNRGTTIVEYITRSEIESYSALKFMNEFMASKSSTNKIHKLLEQHFSLLDKFIKKMYEELKPDHFILTSDHGMAPHKYLGSVTPLLIENGWLIKKQSAGLLKGLRKTLSKVGFNKTTSSLTKKLSPNLRDSFKEINWKSTQAFGNDYISGIYINDHDRFNGPVKRTKDIENLTDEICNAVNADKSFDEVGLRAIKYRINYRHAKFQKYLPDIIFEGAEGIYFDDKGKSVIRRNPNYGSVPTELEKININPFTGEKGRHPLCLLTSKTTQLVSENNSYDLTLIYELTKRVLQSKV